MRVKYTFFMSLWKIFNPKSDEKFCLKRFRKYCFAQACSGAAYDRYGIRIEFKRLFDYYKSKKYLYEK